MEMGQLENRYETPNSRGRFSAESAGDRQTGRARAAPGGFDPGAAQFGAREDQMTEEQKRRELERLVRQQEQLSREVHNWPSRCREVSERRVFAANGISRSQRLAAVLPLRSSAKVPFSAQHSKCGRRRKVTLLPSRRRAAKALENLRQQQQRLNEQGERSVNQLAQNLGQRGQQLLQQQRQLQERIAETSRQQGWDRRVSQCVMMKACRSLFRHNSSSSRS